MENKIKTEPNYKKIYADILRQKFPHKLEQCKQILEKEHLTTTDIFKLNERIFGKQNNQKHRSYSQSDIVEILQYQKKNNLNNIQLANHFRLSRNTVAKWKKLFAKDLEERIF